MLRYLLFGLLLLLPACKRWEASPTAEAPGTENLDLSTLSLNTEPRWLEATTDGVTMGIMSPEGWFGETRGGLLIAEHVSPVEGSKPTAGILVYIFAPPLNEFSLSGQATDSFALHVLEQVIQMPTHVGFDVSVSQPVSFRWDNHDAAYYLLTGADGTRTLVLALTVPDNSNRLVVANISVPAGREAALRETLPRVLHGLEINEITLDGTGLNVLPDPLPFPEGVANPAPVSSP
jgi:hypothetical protein